MWHAHHYQETLFTGGNTRKIITQQTKEIPETTDALSLGTILAEHDRILATGML